MNNLFIYKLLKISNYLLHECVDEVSYDAFSVLAENVAVKGKKKYMWTKNQTEEDIEVPKTP